MLAAALLAVAGACGAFYFQVHAKNGAVQQLALPQHPLPGPGSAILVLSPHSDDETLGVGGLLGEAVRAGARIRVVLLTNGDGFRVAASRRYRKLHPDRATFIRFAYDRQQETLKALARLGVRSDQVTFLGYPDGGLAAMWGGFWTPDRLFTSRFTGCDHAPYSNAFRPGAPYCGASVLQDLEDVMRSFQPTALYLPHPSDDHADHWSTHCYGMLALERLRSERPAERGVEPIRYGVASDRPGWAQQTRVYCYLIHRGDWPVPQGRHVGAQLVPPASLLHLDTQWESLPLRPEARDAKEQALLAYESQMAVMGRFLRSFVRRDELFGVLPPIDLTSVPASSGAESTYLEDWGRCPPVIADSSRDSLMRNLDGRSDLTAIYAAAGPERLHLRLVTRRPPSPRVAYHLRLRAVGCADETRSAIPFTLVFSHYTCSRRGVSFAYRRNGLELSLPLAALGSPQVLFLGADTSAQGVAMDRIAWRMLRLPARGQARRKDRASASPSPSRLIWRTQSRMSPPMIRRAISRNLGEASVTQKR
jgi:LmbE family N-acetylglucosaminyl deacetylase